MALALRSESDTLYTVSRLVERVRENEAKLRSFRNLELRLIACLFPDCSFFTCPC